MEAPKTLRRPANWQDFESLCKKLWGEIWNCPEIQKNGRLGQDQSGVDVFGMPNNEDSYYGIQCKGKTEYNDEQYNHPQFTEKEINEEIKKAKNFKPSLKKFYLATTALNDAKIQAFVRKKNIEHKKKGLFEVHLFCWETIVDLIDENRHTHDWYVNSQNYKSNKSVKVTFQDDSTELKVTVPFQQVVTEYKQKAIAANPALQSWLTPSTMFGNLSIERTSLFDHKINHSYFKFYLRIHNTGIDSIEDFKILLQFEGKFQDLDRVSKGEGDIIANLVHYSYNIFINKEEKSGKIVPSKKILVGDDTMGFDDIMIKPLHEETVVLINWKLISKDFKDDGQLKLTLVPEMKRDFRTVLVEDPFKVRIERGEISDYITDSRDSE
jgi:hypothetical protein